MRMGGERRLNDGGNPLFYLFSDHCFVASREKILRIEYSAVKFLRFVCQFHVHFIIIVTPCTHPRISLFALKLRININVIIGAVCHFESAEDTLDNRMSANLICTSLLQGNSQDKFTIFYFLKVHGTIEKYVLTSTALGDE